MEKGGKEKLVWLHREAEESLDAYIKEAGLEDTDAPLFQSLDKAHRLTGEGIVRRDMLDVVKVRCRTAGLSKEFCNHTFRDRNHGIPEQRRGTGSSTGHGESYGPTNDEAL